MSWKQVCGTDEIAPNALKQFEIDGVCIVIANVDGLFVAMPPLCPHMEEPLAESGICDRKVLTCTKHLWQWNLLSGEAVGMAERPLLMYQARAENGSVYVFVDKELVYDYEDADEDDDW